MSLTTAPVSPKATPLPPLPTEDPLTPAQWKTLLAIADAVIPAIKPMSTARTITEVAVTDNEYATAVSALRALVPEDNSGAEDAVKQYLGDHASANPAFRMELQRVFSMYMPQSTRKELAMVLNILEYVHQSCTKHMLPWECRLHCQGLRQAYYKS
jgi:hypothetical protein